MSRLDYTRQPQYLTTRDWLAGIVGFALGALTLASCLHWAPIVINLLVKP